MSKSIAIANFRAPNNEAYHRMPKSKKQHTLMCRVKTSIFNISDQNAIIVSVQSNPNPTSDKFKAQ